VLNRDDASYEYLSRLTQVQQISYGLGENADIRAVDIRYEPDSLRFTVLGLANPLPLETHLVGDYNISNCLAAIAIAVAGLGVDPQAAHQALAAVPGIPGRMERIDLGQDFLAYVDFAHTPNALSVALKTARRLAHGKVIAVFGSAGLRDRAKRRMMAETAVELADSVIFTAEDPRTESLEAILAEMEAGAVTRGGVEGESFWKIPDRADAFRYAVDLAQSGDLVIVCGKGHEQSMCFGTVEYPWDDRIALRAAIAERFGISGPEMPVLPTGEH
jgi:UDP-N-acetylmuramoyl-L-alanyl-D-glutamate--2,6-diaminopimelate ligase